MAEVSKATRAVHTAHTRILKAYERARNNIADIPLGHERVDPRTARKRIEGSEGLDSTLSRMLYEMRSNQNGEQ